MTIILFLILASLSLAFAALLGFVWAVRTGQFEDTCTPAMRLLADEPRTPAHAIKENSPKI